MGGTMSYLQTLAACIFEPYIRKMNRFPNTRRLCIRVFYISAWNRDDGGLRSITVDYIDFNRPSLEWQACTITRPNKKLQRVISLMKRTAYKRMDKKSFEYDLMTMVSRLGETRIYL